MLSLMALIAAPVAALASDAPAAKAQPPAAARIVRAAGNGLDACLSTIQAGQKLAGQPQRAALAGAKFVQIGQNPQQETWAWALTSLEQANDGAVIADFKLSYPCGVTIAGGAALTPQQSQDAVGKWAMANRLVPQPSSRPDIRVWIRPWPESGSKTKVIRLETTSPAPGILQASVQAAHSN